MLEHCGDKSLDRRGVYVHLAMLLSDGAHVSFSPSGVAYDASRPGGGATRDMTVDG
jgi:hypothetical protein